MTPFWEILLYILSILFLFPFVIYTLTKKDLFWTFLETGNIKYIYVGDTLKRVIADVEGWKVNGTKLVLLSPGEKIQKNWLGVYWIGIPPFSSVKRFNIKRRKEREDIDGRPQEEWIRDLPEIEVNSLRFAFPRPFLLKKVELKDDQQTVDLLIICKFIVVDAYIPVPELKGEFFDLAGSILRGSVIDTVKEQKTIIDFTAADKGEGGILKDLTEKNSALNEALKKRVGLRLVGIAISEWDPSETETREAMIAEAIAKAKAKGIVAEAEGEAKQIMIRAEANAKAEVIAAKARGVRIEETVKALATSSGSQDVIARGAADILEMEAATGPNSKLITLVKGKAAPVIPMGGDK